MFHTPIVLGGEDIHIPSGNLVLIDASEGRASVAQPLPLMPAYRSVVTHLDFNRSPIFTRSCSLGFKVINAFVQGYKPVTTATTARRYPLRARRAPDL